MAKKKGALGKLIAFTTTVAAIGGVCYVFRDKIKESQAFKTASEKANDLYGTMKSKMGSDDDDFFFDDDWDDESDGDRFDSSDSSNREYTTLTSSKDQEKDDKDDNVNSDEKDNDDSQATDSIPTINLNNETVSGYENEGLSDTSEDPDVLEDQDKLDF